MRRLFVPADELAGSTASLRGDAHRHLARVLRAQAGDALTLFDGAGTEIDATVVTVGRGATTVALGARRTVRAGGGVEIVLLQGLARGERMDFIVQKTTELGVARIVPVVAARSIAKPGAESGAVRTGRRARWETIAREAARQSGRADVPVIDDAVPLATALSAARATAADPADGHPRLALWEASRGHPLRQALTSAPRRVTLLVGPEGGFAEAEIAAADEAGFQVVGLGPRILRVETAAVVAVALVQAATGGLD